MANIFFLNELESYPLVGDEGSNRRVVEDLPEGEGEEEGQHTHYGLELDCAGYPVGIV